ncbi:hypothetical protein LSH36_84g04018, partial [Paralvinella palmiformis]
YPYLFRFTTTLACMMDLHYYPLDVQNCTIEIESYGYPMQDVVMKWRGNSKEKAVHGVMDVAIPQFTIIDYRTVTTKEVLDTVFYRTPSGSQLTSGAMSHQSGYLLPVDSQSPTLYLSRIILSVGEHHQVLVRILRPDRVFADV